MKPPRRICPGCGGEHFAWSESQPCSRCKVDLIVAEGRAEIARLAREHREGLRRLELEEATAPVKPSPVPYNEFPDGF